MKLHSRIVKEGAEATFVDSFLRANDLFQDEKLEYMVLQETITDGGISDILVVSWERNSEINWNKDRNNLGKQDLKILHFISSKKSKGISIRTLVSNLGYNQKEINSTIQKLKKSSLIELNRNRVIVKKLKDNFFVRDIIAIEAKLKNWKKAIEQANLNLNFSSKSYVLVPEPNTSKLNKFHEDLNTGLITFDGNKAKVVIKARKNKLPGSYYSWLINEHIGRVVNER